jgi:hypothetical protein
VPRRVAVIATAAVLAIVAGVIALVVFTAGPPQSVGPLPSSNSAPPLGGIRVWMMTAPVVTALAAQPDIRSALAADRIYEILRPGQQPETGLNIVPTISYGSEADLAAAVTGGQLPSYVKAVLYDNEHWSATPTAEQIAPATYYKLAAEVAHSNGLQLVATPAIDLVEVTSSGATNAEEATQFLRTNILKDVAPYADVIDVQAQRLETDQQMYSKFLESAVAQIRAANSQVMIVGGISIHPSSTESVVADLVMLVATSHGYVSGYWLNVPGPASASDLTSARLDLALEFVRQLART